MDVVVFGLLVILGFGFSAAVEMFVGMLMASDDEPTVGDD